MLNQMTSFFRSAFYFSGTKWELILLAIALGLVFGAIWLIPFRPPLFKNPRLWLVALASAILTWTAIAFVQIPLQQWTGRALVHFWSVTTLTKWLLLAGIPQTLLSGIVQEAAKLAPVFIFWWVSKKSFTPKFGLIVGAVSGAGFGVFEAIWVHNQILASGWSLAMIGTYGFTALLGFWERIFAVGFHVSSSALVGYGVAKRKVWQFYLLAAFLHGFLNYGVILLQKNILNSVQEELVSAAFVVVVAAFVMWLRWSNTKETPVNPPTGMSDTMSAPEPQTPVSRDSTQYK